MLSSITTKPSVILAEDDTRILGRLRLVASFDQIEYTSYFGARGDWQKVTVTVLWTV